MIPESIIRHLKGRHRTAPTARRAATAIEYGLMAALIGVAIFTGVQATGINLKTVFGTIELKVTAAVDPAAPSGTATPAIPADEMFSVFVAAVQTPGCTTPDATSAFEATDGTVITDGTCGDAFSQNETFQNLNDFASGSVDFFNPTGGAVTVPPLGGADTGFTVPADLDAQVFLEHPFIKSGGSEVGTASFEIDSLSSSLTMANTQSEAAVCGSLGGTFSITFSGHFGTCNADTASMPLDIATSLGATQ
jgi:Flp pilus assembly pilin Flp